MGASIAHSTGRLFSRPSRSHSSARLRRSSCLTAVIELMRPSRQRKSEVEGVAAPAGVRVFFIAQPQCPVRVAQYPGANRAEDTGCSFGIVVEDVCKMAMLLVVVEVQHLVGVLHSLGELARTTVAGAGKSCVP